MKDVQKTKVIFYIPNLIIGGVETVFINTMEELLKNPGLGSSCLYPGNFILMNEVS